jgi:hypothetical protein
MARLPTLALLLCLASAPTLAAPDDETTGGDLHLGYGFDGLIVSAFNDGLFGLAAGDLDGDGSADLALVNNAKARIELLLHRGDVPLDAEALELTNELPDELHFRRESLATEEKVTAMTLADLDLDGRADIVFTGDSAKLSVAFAGPDADFARRITLPLTDGAAGARTLATGDVDGDGLPDVVALAKGETVLFLADDPGSLAEGKRLPNASSSVDALHLADLDGDGLLDLLCVVSESETPLRVRAGLAGGSFGPELRTPHPPLRSHAVADVDGDGVAEVLAVARRSGRVIRLALSDDVGDDGDPPVLSAPLVSPLAGGSSAGRRSPVLTDLDRDGRPDLLVAEAGSARLLVHPGGEGGRFGGALSYPSLLGSAWPWVVDRDGDGLPEVVLAAPDEQAVAVATVDPEGRIGFPVIAGAPGGDLLALAQGDLDGDGRSETWIVVGEGKGRKKQHRLKRLDEGVEGFSMELEDLATDPSGLALVDLDRDGRLDVVVTVPTEAPALLFSREGEQPLERVEADGPGLGILEGVGPWSYRPVDVDGDGLLELLVPGANFARALYLDGDGRPQVLAQFNLDQPGARVGATTAADVTGDGRAEILVYDETTRELVVLAQQADGPRVIDRVSLGELSPEAMLPEDLDGDGDDDLLVWSQDGFASLLSGGGRPGFAAVAHYESPVKDAYLTELAVGDVNGDGGPDLVALETSKHLVHIAAADADGIHHALRFPVYEARLFESSRRASREPREVVVADVTGDGWQDVALLVHDRLIVYPQEPPP